MKFVHMLLANRSWCKKMISTLIIYLLLIVPCFANWIGPENVLTGLWGGEDDQFGIRSEDSADIIPILLITSSGDIVIRDGVNRRLKVYDLSGQPKTIIGYRSGRHYTEMTLADSYGFTGDFVGYGSNQTNYYYRLDQKKYIQFTSTGQLLKTYTEKPLELGGVKSKRLITETGDLYKITVTYADKKYDLTSDREFMRHMRIGDKVYGINPGGVWRFGQCGKVEGNLIMPTTGTETVTRPELGGKSVDLSAEYGEPVLGPNGDVYTWKRTILNYSIVKWTWQDDPSVPSGPDAPSGLSVMASTSGLYLTWTASSQDPGCVTGYEISRATSAGGVGSTIATVNAGILKYNDSTASAGTTYYYKIRAAAGSEYSTYSNEASGKR